MLEKFVEFFIRILFCDSSRNIKTQMEQTNVHYTIASVFPPQYSSEDIQALFRIEPKEYTDVKVEISA